MPDMRNVFSSHISQIGYDDATQELHVVYRKGGKSGVYDKVPKQVADQVLMAPSIGTALHQLVRGQFPHRYV
jgi:hypothetical protein